MKAITTSLVLFATVLGCGGAGPPDSIGPINPGTGGATVPPGVDPLVQDWFSQLSATCFQGINLRPGGVFVERLGCIDPTTLAISIEENDGTWSHDTTYVYVTLSASTCSDAQTPYRVPYAFAGSTLQLTYTSELLLLTPNTSTGGVNGAATFGCYRSGTFTASPLAPL